LFCTGRRSPIQKAAKAVVVAYRAAPLYKRLLPATVENMIVVCSRSSVGWSRDVVQYVVVAKAWGVRVERRVYTKSLTGWKQWERKRYEVTSTSLCTPRQEVTSSACFII
jgi:hypothetical protein